MLQLARRILLVIVLSQAAGLALAEGALVLNTGVRQPYTTADNKGFLDRLTAEAFRRIGHPARVQVYDSSERALINANGGIDDGTVLRIRGLEAQYPNLIRVPEKVMDNDFVAYSLQHHFVARDWDSLQPYQVSYILGWKVFESNLPQSVSATRVRSPEQLFSLLRLGRTEVVLYERWQGLWRARELGLPVKVIEPPLANAEMFMYLHKTHAHLVPRLADTLAAMKRDGSYQRIYDAAFKPLAAIR